MFKLKGWKSRLTCKQIGGTYTYGRLLMWGQGKTYFQVQGKEFISNCKQY